jgi:hypothetical protein
MPSFSNVVRPKTGLPNWALGVLFGGLVAATYYVSLQRLGHVDNQLEKESRKQEAAERAAAQR